MPTAATNATTSSRDNLIHPPAELAAAESPVQPVAPSSRRVLYALLALGVLGVAVAAVLLLGGTDNHEAVARSDKPGDKPVDSSSGPSSDNAVPTRDPESTTPSGTTNDDTDDIEIDGPSPAPASRPSVTTPPSTTSTRTSPTSPTSPRTATATTTTTARTSTASGSSATNAPAVTPAATANVGTVAADGCDKVSCVIDNFARPCCEPFRPRKAGELPYELDKSMITAGMAKAKAAVIRCGEQIKATGIVKIAMEVGGDGRVASATVAEAPDAALGECVANAVRKVSFARTDAGGTFTYPFKF